MTQLPRKAAGPRPNYFEDPAIDKVLSMTLALAGEVAVLRDRLDTVERLLARGEKVAPSVVDTYQPTLEEKRARDDWRENFLDIVLRRVHQEKESLEAMRSQVQYETIVQDVAKN